MCDASTITLLHDAVVRTWGKLSSVSAIFSTSGTERRRRWTEARYAGVGVLKTAVRRGVNPVRIY